MNFEFEKWLLSDSKHSIYKNVFSTYQVENSVIVYFIQFRNLCKGRIRISDLSFPLPAKP